jgi:hypothetical protein
VSDATLKPNAGVEEVIAAARAKGDSGDAATKTWVLDLITHALRDRPPTRPPNETLLTVLPKQPSKFMSREWLVALAVIIAGGLLIYKGEMDRGIELVKWTMVAFIGSRTAVKGLEVFKKSSA